MLAFPIFTLLTLVAAQAQDLDMGTRQPAQIASSSRPLYGLASDGGQRFVAVGDGSTILLTNGAGRPKEFGRFPANQTLFLCAYLPKQDSALVFSQDGEARRITNSGAFSKVKVPASKSQLSAVAVDRAEERLAVGRIDGSVDLLTPSGNPVLKLAGSTPVLTIGFAPRASYLAVGGKSAELQLWQLGIDRPTGTSLHTPSKDVTRLAWLDDTDLIFGSSSGRLFRVHDPLGKRPKIDLLFNAAVPVTALAADAGSSRIAVGLANGDLLLIGGSEAPVVQHRHRGAVTGVAFAEGGRSVASVGIDGALRLAPAKDGGED